MRRRKLIRIALLCALALPLASQEHSPAAAGGFQIGGVLINATNNLPLAQAYVTITLSGGSFSRTVTTGDDGRFNFEHLRAGQYQLSAERHGFGVQSYEQHEGRFSTAIVTGSERDTTNLTFRVWPDASFSGRIADERNEAVRNVHVMLVRELMVDGRRGKRIVGNTYSDDQGHYHFGHLKPGAYYIAVSARPWYATPAFLGRMGFREGGNDAPVNPAIDVAYPLTFYPDVTDAASASAITLQAGDRASADIMLRAVPALHVRIRNAPEDGERQQFVGATLAQMIFDGIEVPMQSMMREMGGRIVMMGIPPGRYLLRVAPNARRVRRMDPPGSEESEPPPVRVGEVELVADTELDASEMPIAAVVSGTVKLPNGQASAKPPAIVLRRGTMRREFSARANANGEFSFPQGFAAGSYELVMSSSDDLYIRTVTAAGAKVAGRMLHISGPEAVKLTVVTIAGTGKVEGVAQRDGKPVSGAMILLAPQDLENNFPLVRRDQSNSDGSFTLSPVVPGRYRLLALENGWDMQWGDVAVLKPFLENAEAIVVEAKGNYNVRPKVQ